MANIKLTRMLNLNLSDPLPTRLGPALRGGVPLQSEQEKHEAAVLAFNRGDHGSDHASQAANPGKIIIGAGISAHVFDVEPTTSGIQVYRARQKVLTKEEATHQLRKAITAHLRNIFHGLLGSASAPIDLLLICGDRHFAGTVLQWTASISGFVHGHVAHATDFLSNAIQDHHAGIIGIWNVFGDDGKKYVRVLTKAGVSDFELVHRVRTAEPAAQETKVANEAPVVTELGITAKSRSTTDEVRAMLGVQQALEGIFTDKIKDVAAQLKASGMTGDPVRFNLSFGLTPLLVGSIGYAPHIGGFGNDRVKYIARKLALWVLRSSPKATNPTASSLTSTASSVISHQLITVKVPEGKTFGHMAFDLKFTVERKNGCSTTQL